MNSKIFPQPRWLSSIPAPRPWIVIEALQIQADEHGQPNRGQNVEAIGPAVVLLKPIAGVENKKNKLRKAEQRSQQQPEHDLIQDRVPQPCREYRPGIRAQEPLARG